MNYSTFVVSNTTNKLPYMEIILQKIFYRMSLSENTCKLEYLGGGFVVSDNSKSTKSIICYHQEVLWELSNESITIVKVGKVNKNVNRPDNIYFINRICILQNKYQTDGIEKPFGLSDNTATNIKTIQKGIST